MKSEDFEKMEKLEPWFKRMDKLFEGLKWLVTMALCMLVAAAMVKVVMWFVDMGN